MLDDGDPSVNGANQNGSNQGSKTGGGKKGAGDPVAPGASSSSGRLLYFPCSYKQFSSLQLCGM